jgi:hypothetical protein
MKTMQFIMILKIKYADKFERKEDDLR